MNTDVVMTPRSRFDILFGKLVQFMRAKTNRQIDDQFYERVCFYPEAAVKNAIDNHIDIHRPTAGNFPTPSDLASSCALWLNARPRMKHDLMRYDPVEDFDFPVEFLHDAFGILDKQGIKHFQAYCERMRMPAMDRERVIMKHRSVMAKKDVNVAVGKILSGINR